MSILNKIWLSIKDPYRQIVKILYMLSPYINKDETYLRILYYLRTHKTLNLKNPQTFGEKLQWLKIYNRKPEYTMMVDKYAVKEYVANIIGKEHVIPTLGVWDKSEDSDWDSLPAACVLKTTQGGGDCGVVICKDKNLLDCNEIIRKLKNSMKQNIYVKLKEWPYKNVQPRIIAEKYMEDESGSELKDYKFYCFYGEPRYCQVIQNRRVKETIDLFDMEWRHQEFVGLNPMASPATACPSKPMHYELMQEIAQTLSVKIPFSRIDLYEVNEKVYFGEITFYPASGLGTFSPSKYNSILGKMIILPSNSSI